LEGEIERSKQILIREKDMAATIASMNESIQEKDHQLQAAKNEKEGLRSSLLSLQGVHDALKNANSILKSEAEKKEASYMVLIKDAQSKDSERGEVEKRLSALMEEQREEIRKLTREREERQRENEIKLEYISKLESERENHAIVVSHRDELKSTLVEVQELMRGEVTKVERLQSEVHLKERELQEALSDISIAREDLANEQLEKEILASQVNELIDERDKFKAALDSCAFEIDNKNSSISTSESKILGMLATLVNISSFYIIISHNDSFSFRHSKKNP
jgi:chromosome segregation ATPase